MEVRGKQSQRIGLNIHTVLAYLTVIYYHIRSAIKNRQFIYLFISSKTNDIRIQMSQKTGQKGNTIAQRMASVVTINTHELHT